MGKTAIRNGLNNLEVNALGTTIMGLTGRHKCHGTTFKQA